MLTPAIAEQMLYKLMNAEFKLYPFPHLIIDQIWPDNFHETLRRNLPPKEAYGGIYESGRQRTKDGSAAPKETRFIFSLANDVQKLSGEQQLFWKSVADFMLSQRFCQLAIAKFMPFIQQRFAGRNLNDFRTLPVAELFRDTTDYQLGPHSDAPSRLLNLFFYLPEDDSKPHLGTSFYVQNDPTRRYESGPHYNYGEFTRTATAPYRRNVMAGFFKNDVSFHGVEPVKEPDFVRNALAFYMRVKDKD